MSLTRESKNWLREIPRGLSSSVRPRRTANRKWLQHGLRCFRSPLLQPSRSRIFSYLSASAFDAGAMKSFSTESLPRDRIFPKPPPPAHRRGRHADRQQGGSAADAEARGCCEESFGSDKSSPHTSPSFTVSSYFLEPLSCSYTRAHVPLSGGILLSSGKAAAKHNTESIKKMTG